MRTRASLRGALHAVGRGRAMIGFLRGTLISKRPPSLTLDVGGVGYELEAPMSTFYRLPDTGQPLSLVTHLVVREDAHVLFGFFTEAERALFRSSAQGLERRPAHRARRAVGHERRRVLSVRARQGSREPHEDPRRRPQDRRAAAARDGGSPAGVARHRHCRACPRARRPKARRTARCSRSATSPARSCACSRISTACASAPRK